MSVRPSGLYMTLYSVASRFIQYVIFFISLFPDGDGAGEPSMSREKLYEEYKTDWLSTNTVAGMSFDVSCFPFL